jgi:hypothetical protein
MEREPQSGFITMPMDSLHNELHQINAMKDQRTNIDTPQIADSPHGQIARQLQDAIHELQADVARVELWASALASFMQPIPNYRPGDTPRLRQAGKLVGKQAEKTPRDEA